MLHMNERAEIMPSLGTLFYWPARFSREKRLLDE